jgi:hypothetical protein
MKPKPLTGRRPQEAMVRFDRLLAAMAPKPAAPASPTASPKRTKKKSRARDAKAAAK